MTLYLKKSEFPLPIWTNLNLLHWRMFCVKWLKLTNLIWIWRFFLYFNILLISSIRETWGVALQLNKLESPSFKDALCQDWMKLARGSRKGFLNFVNICFHYFVIISPWKIAWPFIWKNLIPLHRRILCAKFKCHWLSGSGEEDLMCALFVISSCMALYLNKLNPLFPRMHCAKSDWNWLSGSGEEDFQISSMYFRYFATISPWKGTGLFIFTTLNPLHPRMLCAKFIWNWLSGSGEEDLLILSMYFRYFVIISP